MKLNEAINRYLASFGRKPDADVIVAYNLVLSDLTEAQQRTAFNLAMRQDREHPLSAGQLRALGGGAQPITTTARARRAWLSLDHALNVRRPSFQSPIAAVVSVLMGSFQALQLARNQSITDFNTWKKREFFEIYGEMVESDPDRVAQVERQPHQPKRLATHDTEYDVFVKLHGITQVLPPPVKELESDDVEGSERKDS